MEDGHCTYYLLKGKHISPLHTIAAATCMNSELHTGDLFACASAIHTAYLSAMPCTLRTWLAKLESRYTYTYMTYTPDILCKTGVETHEDERVRTSNLSVQLHQGRHSLRCDDGFDGELVNGQEVEALGVPRRQQCGLQSPGQSLRLRRQRCLPPPQTQEGPRRAAGLPAAHADASHATCLMQRSVIRVQTVQLLRHEYQKLSGTSCCRC